VKSNDGAAVDDKTLMKQYRNTINVRVRSAAISHTWFYLDSD
jgi:hypothetical protein